jgi:hypothetical protein
MITEPKIYTVSQAAQRLDLSAVRVRQFCQEGRIGRKLGNLWVIDSNELQRFARQKRPVGAKSKKNRKTVLT